MKSYRKEMVAETMEKKIMNLRGNVVEAVKGVKIMKTQYSSIIFSKMFIIELKIKKYFYFSLYFKYYLISLKSFVLKI